MDQPTAPGMIPTYSPYQAQNYDPSTFNPWAMPSSSPASSQYGFGSQMPGIGNTDPNAGITQFSGVNGYQGGYNIQPATDPYAAQIQWGENQAGGYASQATAQLPGMMNGLDQSQQGLNQYAASSGYPSYPNAAGAGNQMAGASQPAAQPMNTTNMAGSSDPSTGGAYGMNPWSLTGEAMTRK